MLNLNLVSRKGVSGYPTLTGVMGSRESLCSRFGEKESLREGEMLFPEEEGGAHRFPKDGVSAAGVLAHS